MYPNWPPYNNYPFQGPSTPFIYVPVPMNNNKEEKKEKKSWRSRETKKNPFKELMEYNEALEEFNKKWEEKKKGEKKDDKKKPEVRMFNALEVFLLLVGLGPFVGMAWKYAFTHLAP